MGSGHLDIIAQTCSRRAALRSLGAAGAGSALGGLLPARARARKRKGQPKRCKSPKGRCGQKCVALDTAANCGSCGVRCAVGESCLAGVCCPATHVICRGECRAVCPEPAALRPFPQHLDYGASKPSAFSRDQLDDHVRTAYDRWKERYVVAAGRDNDGHLRSRIAFGKPSTDNHQITVSEGQGYGMVIVAIMAGHDTEAQEIFDGLWRFARAHPSEIDDRLMDWRVPGGNGNDSAFDGDCDMAYGLLLADAQWGSEGAIDYGAAFAQTSAGILASTIGPESHLPLLGDWAAGQPDSATYNQYTPRTSDFMPGHFRAFARATSDDVWDDVVAACQGVITSLQEQFSPETGLLPDFVQPMSASDHRPRPASPGFLEGASDGDYAYNAGRDPWRLATDALLNGDGTSAAQAGKITTWAKTASNGNPEAFRAGYHLNGDPLPGSDYFTSFFVAPLGVAAMADASLQAWLNAIYGAVYDRQEDYFEDSVTLLCLLVMTGNFWDPTRR